MNTAPGTPAPSPAPAAPRRGKLLFALLVLGTAGAAAGVTALLMNIASARPRRASPTCVLAEVTEDDTDPAMWGVNWPKQYDSYKRTALTTRTRFGGHGGSEAMPDEKIERDPWLKRMFLGYAFSIDYRDRRGHAYMLADQEATKRLTKPQSGSCLHCHASVMPLYRELGDGDAMKGFEASHKLTYQEASAKLHELGHAHPVACVDCHDPDDDGAARDAPRLHPRHPGARRARTPPVPAIPSIDAWRERQPREALRPERRRPPRRDALVRLRPVPRRVLLRPEDAAHLPVGQGPERRPDRGLLGRDQVPRRRALLRLRARRDAARES